MESLLSYPLEYVIVLFVTVFIVVVLPNVSYLLFGWIFTRFERTRDLGVKFFAMSMLSAKLPARYCRRDCARTLCRNWTCENYSRCKVNDK